MTMTQFYNDARGRSLLHWLAVSDRGDLVALALQLASTMPHTLLNRRDDRGERPIDVAARRGFALFILSLSFSLDRFDR